MIADGVFLRKVLHDSVGFFNRASMLDGDGAIDVEWGNALVKFAETEFFTRDEKVALLESAVAKYRTAEARMLGDGVEDSVKKTKKPVVYLMKAKAYRIMGELSRDEEEARKRIGASDRLASALLDDPLSVSIGELVAVGHERQVGGFEHTRTLLKEINRSP